MNSITFQGDEYSLPSSWNEITNRQLELIARIVLATIYPVDLLVKLSLSFMGMRLSMKKPCVVNGVSHFYVKRGRKRVYLVNALQIHSVSKCLDYVIADGRIQSDLTRNPYPRLGRIFRRLYGPSDYLYNLTFGEFIQAEIERDGYAKTGDEQYLHRMLAILWRPTCWLPVDGDFRAPLRMDRVAKRSQRIARLPKYKVRVMLWYYEGCLAFMMKKFETVFTSGGEGHSGAFDSFMQMVNLLASNNLVNVEKIREAYLYDALYTLKNIIETHEKNEHNR